MHSLLKNKISFTIIILNYFSKGMLGYIFYRIRENFLENS